MEMNTNHDSDFVKEKIKERPLNKKKLLKRTLITAMMAVVFSLVACLTFLLLEPVISNKLYPEEETPAIKFPEETKEEEVLPEDMIADEAQMQAENAEQAITLEDEQIRAVVEQMLAEKKLGMEDYLALNESMLTIAREAQKSVVTVTGLTSDVDWFNNPYERKGQITGVIVADNTKELLILVNTNPIKNAETIKVTFYGGEQYEAEIRRKDANTGLTVIAVPKALMNEDLLKDVGTITLGSSMSGSSPGNLIIAVGRIVGNAESVCYGAITSSGNTLNLTDATYKLITTDIYGSSSATGILLDTRGQVVGIIDNSFNSVDARNIVSAIGISELKKFIEKMLNDVEIAYFGVYGTDVTVDAYENLQVPYGAYITEIDMESPAMSAGIQSGDVIVKLGDADISSFTDYVYILLTCKPEQTVSATIMRQGPDGYREMEVEVVLGHSR